MDYQFVFVAVQLFSVVLNPVNAIVSRDLILTPKQDFQQSGKTLYYVEESNYDVLRNHSATTTVTGATQRITLNKPSSSSALSAIRPWERTLKHVAFITLFTNTAAGAEAGNVSKLKEYADFLHSPYISNGQKDVRFGDIVTLASGRLEETIAATGPAYRFVEGVCEYDCGGQERIRALWQVQKIRHRDDKRKYRHEIRYSISPLQPAERTMGANKRRADVADFKAKNSQQTFIQKEDDYPQNFARIVYRDEKSFSERNLAEYQARRNYNHQHQQGGTPIPQSTFLHGIFQPHPGLVPPRLPPLSQAPPVPPQTLNRLNIGEYMQNYNVGQVPAPQLELVPNILQFMTRTNMITPTTYRPNYQFKLPRPELYQPPLPPLPPHPQQLQPPYKPENAKFPPNAQEFFSPENERAVKLTTPVVTHHFHHHFYTPNSAELAAVGEAAAAGQQHIHKPENDYKPNPQANVGVTPVNAHKPETNFGETPQYYNLIYDEPTSTTIRYHQPLPPAPQKHNFAQDFIQQHHVVHVTQAPPLKKPTTIYHHQPYPVRMGGKIPILPYSGAQPHDPVLRIAKPNKTFTQSEPMNEAAIRYSEPDPLYLSGHPAIQHDQEQSYELNAPQLEAPRIGGSYAEYENDVLLRNELIKLAQPDDSSISAQLPPPGQDQEVGIPYEDTEEPKFATAEANPDQEHKPSQNNVQISSTETTSAENLAPTTTTPTTTPTETTTPPPTTTPSALSITTTKTDGLLATKNYRRQTLVTPVTSATTTPAATTTTTATTSRATTMKPSATKGSIQNSAHNTDQQFVSTSTSESPLRAVVSRYRGAGSYARSTTTTTEQPVLKWKPRRKHVNKSAIAEEDTKAKGSLRHEKTAKLLRGETKTKPTTEQANDNNAVALTATTAPTTTPTATMSVTTATLGDAATMPVTIRRSSKESYEVHTQKSISKSISIKIGANGEEIPIIIDDDDDTDEDSGSVDDKDDETSSVYEDTNSSDAENVKKKNEID